MLVDHVKLLFFILPRPLKYEAQVMKEVPADRLLIWQVKQNPKHKITKCKIFLLQVKQGWEPLCQVFTIQLARKDATYIFY